MIIIGITGTIGAGKGTIVESLVREKGFAHFSAREFIMEEVRRRGMPENRDSTTPVANDLRAKFGPNYIAEELYRRAQATGKDAVIESLRAPAEVEALRAKGNFTLFAVDADPKTRYERIQSRRSETDRISFEKFLADERREMENPEKHQQNIAACIAMADHRFENNGTVAELERQVEVVLSGMTNDGGIPAR